MCRSVSVEEWRDSYGGVESGCCFSFLGVVFGVTVVARVFFDESVGGVCGLGFCVSFAREDGVMVRWVLGSIAGVLGSAFDRLIF